MKYIDEDRIADLLTDSVNAEGRRLDEILRKAMSLKRLELDESALLLSANSPEDIGKIFAAASYVKDAIYGRRVVLFAPLYISNVCVNNCLYCGFKSDNKSIARKTLTVPEVRSQAEWLLKRGHKRVLMVCGEHDNHDRDIIDYYVRSIEAIYAAETGNSRVRRVNVNCAPLGVDDFLKLKNAGIGTFQIFQETYHDQTYRRMHPKGPKSDPDKRLDAIERAFKAGIDDIGIGALYGLYDYKFETLGILSHVEQMEKQFKIGPHTISVPRIEPASGAEISLNPPYQVSDEDFRKVVAVLRLSVPYTGIILSTRENAAMRDSLLSLGVSQISAGSNTSPGGYSDTEGKNASGQFLTGDHRTLDDMVGALIKHDYIPSFCAACYRKERTGESFMRFAKDGTIKDKCGLNALVTLREYLDDFASPTVKDEGYSMIERYAEKLETPDKEQFESISSRVAQGRRDEYV